jgi:hypothetical protein
MDSARNVPGQNRMDFSEIISQTTRASIPMEPREESGGRRMHHEDVKLFLGNSKRAQHHCAIWSTGLEVLIRFAP